MMQEREKDHCIVPTLGDMASDFENYMDNVDYCFFDNLMPILDRLPLIKIHKGYELDVFQNGSHFFGSLQTYCCKEGASISYIPKKHGVYNDSLRMPNTIIPEIAKSIPAALSYFDVPFTESGILQAWLLNNVTDFMPKWMPAFYSTKHFIFNYKSLDKIFNLTGSDSHSLVGTLKRMSVRNQVLGLNIESLLPSVTIIDDTAILEYTYWNDLSGLVKVRTTVIKDGTSIKFLEPNEAVLVKNESEKMF